MSRSTLHISWIVGLVITLGCSRPDTVEVSGFVEWEAAPIPQGDIVFFSRDPHVPAAAGKITDGAFRFRTKPGEKRVEIRSFRLSGKKTPQGRPIGEMYIPKRYNDDSELTADVTLGGENKFDFKLKR
jgi:hypothetical protein